MELSSTLLDAISRPAFIFKYHSLKDQFVRHTDQTWSDSQLNPKNRVNSLDTSKSRWQVDGASAYTTQFFIAPLRLIPSLPPRRIDVFVPCQSQHSKHVREGLDLSNGVPLQNGRAIAKLAISKHLCRALDSHCDRNPDFLDQYGKLPFGSSLVFENLSLDVAKMRLTVVPGHDVERRFKSLSALRQEWSSKFPNKRWPEAIEIDRLRLVQQLHDTVSVVSLETVGHGHPEKAFVFKSSTRSPQHLYHELEYLLSLPAHPNIMPPPCHIVVKKRTFGAKKVVVGFLLPLFPKGSIRDLLPIRQRDGSLSLATKLSWCIEITSAMVHLHDKYLSFYSDLRPDNVLLSEDDHGHESLILCDFEQRGNHYDWCPPEVLYPMYAENLSANAGQDPILAGPMAQLLENISLPDRSPDHPHGSVDDFVYKCNRSWFSMSRSCQEKAQVYSLGLFIYCIFEGLSSIRTSVAYEYPEEPRIDFPEMQYTPLEIQKLIRDCTCGTSLWPPTSEPAEDSFSPRSKVAHREPHQPVRVVRWRHKLYMERHGLVPEECCNDSGFGANGVLDTILQTWFDELGRAEAFWQATNGRRPDLGRTA